MTAHPHPALTIEEAEHAWRQFHAEMCVNTTGRSAARGRRLALASRALLLWDLVMDGPQPATLFVLRQQERARVSRQTILNHLAWLRAEGWRSWCSSVRPRARGSPG